MHLAGLFAPRAGQNFRDEQRRRRSQYDRGTRLAEIEDSYNLSNQECNADVGRIFSNSAQSQSQHANLYSHHTC